MKISKINSGIYAIILLLLFGCLVVGSFYDLDISKNFVDFNSIFGMLFASFGQLPSWILLEFAGVILIKSLNDNTNKKFKVLGWVGGLFAIFIGIFMIYKCENSVWNGLNKYLPVYAEIIIALVLGGLILVGAWFFINVDNKELMIRIVLMIVLTIAIELAVSNIMKIIWSRPRYRLIYDGGTLNGIYYSVDDLFNNWYEFGAGIAKEVFSDTAADNFKSFPSGHTSGATNGLLFFLLPLLNKKLSTKKWSQYLFFAIGFVWFVLVAISRVRFGAHYLSDVTMGAIVSVVVGFVVCEVAPKFKLKEKKSAKTC